MKLKCLISIASILIFVVSALAGCDTTTAPEKESPKKEQPKKDEPYSSSKPEAEQSPSTTDLIESTPPVISPEGPFNSDAYRPGETELATVTHIIDGDTIDVRSSSGRTERVRYTGIDTWETWDQPCGGQGTEANRELVEGKEVRLVKDVSNRDKYDRLLRYVYVGDIFVNAKLVEDGHAQAKDYPPDSEHAAEFAELEQQAKAGGKGCWADDSSEPSEEPEQQSGDLIGNRNSKKLHNLAHSACRGYVGKMSEGNKVFFDSEAEANAAGYYACGRCP